MDIANRYKHAMAAQIRRWLAIFFKGKAICQTCIMATDENENSNTDWCKDENKPRTITKCCDSKHTQHNGSTDCAKSITDHFEKPASFILQARRMLWFFMVKVGMTRPPPSPRHSSLGERERQENANRI